MTWFVSPGMSARNTGSAPYFLSSLDCHIYVYYMAVNLCFHGIFGDI
jgi:hypothetical protein